MEKVHIQIKGIQTDPEGQKTAVDQMLQGEYGVRNGSRYLFYEEFAEGTDIPVKCRMKYRESELELVKQGPVTTQMRFETGKQTDMVYRTPYGGLALSVATDSIIFEEEEKKIRIQIKYRLIAEDEPVSDCSLELLILRA